MFVMIVLLYSKAFITHDGLEIVMMFMNQILQLTNHHYRFPSRVQTLEKWADLTNRLYHGITSYVTCRKCHAMYPVELNRTRNKLCTWKDSYSNAQTCRQELYVNKNSVFVPIQLFHYNSIQSTIQSFLYRPHFVHQLENRRKRYEGYMCDIQDAHAFQTFKLKPTDAQPFAEKSPYNILISIFLDWLQLYSNNSQDVGSVFASIQNLWPSERHLPQYTLTLAILNGPNETHNIHLDHYLRIIAQELQLLQRGVTMRNCRGEDVFVRIACSHYLGDTPALRKEGIRMLCIDWHDC